MTSLSTTETESRESREPRYYDIVSSLFVAIYLISQVSSAKLIAFGPFQVPGAIVLFPLAYIFGDILTEVYGYARTRRVIWTGFFSAVLMALVLVVVQHLPSAPDWPNQGAYEKILGFVPRVVLGSILAYWAGEFANSYVLARLKILTQGRHLWSRTIGSTVVGQAVDSLVFATVAFGGVVPVPILVRIVASIYALKVAYEAAATPLTYIVVNHLKRVERMDVYDHHTNFTPFKLTY
jgi:uncharacterized integral membrane protein (TIGR00697 family)